MDRNGPTAVGGSTIRRSGASRPVDTAPPVERVTGIEPALSAWEADVLPLNYTRGPARTLQEAPDSRRRRRFGRTTDDLETAPRGQQLAQCGTPVQDP